MVIGMMLLGTLMGVFMAIISLFLGFGLLAAAGFYVVGGALGFLVGVVCVLGRKPTQIPATRDVTALPAQRNLPSQEIAQ